MSNSAFQNLIEFLQRLKAAKIRYELSHQRDDALMVEIAVPGERWEVEFFSDGTVEVECFRSKGDIEGEDSLERLFQQFSG
jgi:hypothetical protein